MIIPSMGCWTTWFEFVMVELFGYYYLVTDFLTRFDAASLPPVCAYCFFLCLLVERQLCFM